MRAKTTVISLCVALSVPLSAAAKPPVAGGCEVLVPGAVTTMTEFLVRIAKAPSYPGQWFAPEVSVQITLPVAPGVPLGPNSYRQSVTQTVDGLGGSNDADAFFVIPVLPNLVFGNQIAVAATVSEPLNKNGKLVETATCEAVTVLN